MDSLLKEMDFIGLYDFFEVILGIDISKLKYKGITCSSIRDESTYSASIKESENLSTGWVEDKNREVLAIVNKTKNHVIIIDNNKTTERFKSYSSNDELSLEEQIYTLYDITKKDGVLTINKARFDKHFDEEPFKFKCPSTIEGVQNYQRYLRDICHNDEYYNSKEEYLTSKDSSLFKDLIKLAEYKYNKTKTK